VNNEFKETAMRLLLVQHGAALAKDIDPERPLSKSGVADVLALARVLGNAGVRVQKTLHSGKTRARQTAELLAAEAMPGGEITSTDRLNPKDPVAPMLKQIGGWTADTLVVGHQPFMGRLVTRLLGAEEDSELVAYRPGTVVCLEKDPAGHWILAWMLTPELLAAPLHH